MTHRFTLKQMVHNVCTTTSYTRDGRHMRERIRAKEERLAFLQHYLLSHEDISPSCNSKPCAWQTWADYKPGVPITEGCWVEGGSISHVRLCQRAVRACEGLSEDRIQTAGQHRPGQAAVTSLTQGEPIHLAVRGSRRGQRNTAVPHPHTPTHTDTHTQTHTRTHTLYMHVQTTNTYAYTHTHTHTHTQALKHNRG